MGVVQTAFSTLKATYAAALANLPTSTEAEVLVKQCFDDAIQKSTDLINAEIDALLSLSSLQVLSYGTKMLAMLTGLPNSAETLLANCKLSTAVPT